MRRLKRSPLYLWLVHHGYNKVMNAFTNSTTSSGSDNNGDKNALTGILPSSGLNTNNSADPEELPPLTYDGVTNESSNQNEVTSVTYVEPINEMPNGNELMPDTHDENSSERNELTTDPHGAASVGSLSQNKKTPVTFVESVDEMLYENELISYRHDTTINESLHQNNTPTITTVEPISKVSELTTDTHGAASVGSLCQNKKTPVPFVESLDEMLYENVLISDRHDKTINESMHQNKTPSITIVEHISKMNELTTDTHGAASVGSLCQNKKMPVPFVESLDEMLYENEFISESDDTSISKSFHQNKTSVTTVEPISKMNELTTDTHGTASVGSLSQNKKTSVTFAKSLDEMLYENEFISESDDTTIRKSLSQYTKTSVTFVESLDEMLYENELSATTISESLYRSHASSLSVMEPPYQLSKTKKIVRVIISSALFSLFGILLIIVDISLVIAELADTNIYIFLKNSAISFAISLFFLVDVLLRVYVHGRRHYFSDFFNSLDAVIIGLILLVNIIHISFDFKFLITIPRLAILFRPLRLVILMRVFRLAHQKRHLQMLARRLVSENKRRYQREGFDLDLTYITDRIIAMSFPSSGRQSLYRNPIEEVARFLDTKHANHYQVYNLCSERTYDPKYFHYRVHRIKIDDHNVPTLKQMLLFSKEVQEWMAQDEKNIVVIHCKGGKGRTGTMVCTCLIASEHFLTAKDSTYYFGERRTDKSSSTKFQGIETPSQNRYVGYFEKMKTLYNWNLPPIKILWIKRFIIYSIHGVGKGNGSDLKVEISMQHKTVFPCSSANSTVFHDIETDRVIIEIFNCPALYDDVKVKFLSPELPKYYDNCSFFFWFHTSFIEKNRLYLPRKQLDNPHKSKTWKIYNPKFAVEVYFNETSPSNADFVIT